MTEQKRIQYLDDIEELRRLCDYATGAVHRDQELRVRDHAWRLVELATRFRDRVDPQHAEVGR